MKVPKPLFLQSLAFILYALFTKFICDDTVLKSTLHTHNIMIKHNIIRNNILQIHVVNVSS